MHTPSSSKASKALLYEHMLKFLKRHRKTRGRYLNFINTYVIIIFMRKVKQVARQARIKDPYGTFHITQSGGAKRDLFEKDGEREHFLEILRRAQVKFQFKLYAYCLLSDNAYHLVMDLNGADMSKVMKSINIGYAMYLNMDEPVFKDRYKSTLLKDTGSTLEIVKKLHERGATQESLWNSYCIYDPEKPLRLDWISPITGLAVTKDQEECRDCISSIDEAQMKLTEVSEETGLTLNELFKQKELRNDLILKFRKSSSLSLKELGVLFGGLSESSICKILNTACE